MTRSAGPFDAQPRLAGVRSSRYRVEADEIEIGWTFLVRRHWGGGTNRELERLMLDHAFLVVDDVVSRVHADNVRSQRAIEKLGAVRIEDSVDGYGEPSRTYRLTRG